MNRLLAILLVLVMLLSLYGCREEETNGYGEKEAAGAEEITKKEKRLVEEYSVDEAGQRIDSTIYSYDENGKLFKKEYTHEHGNDQTATYTYDENGRVLTETAVNSYQEGYVYFTTYNYDEMGNVLTKEDSVERDGKRYEVDKEVNTYDEKGRLIKSEGNTAIVATYTYDADGNRKTTELRKRDMLISHTSYTYDSAGKVLTETQEDYDGGGHSTTIVNYTYDQNGNLLTREHTFHSGDSYAYTYTHDNMGNVLTEVKTSPFGTGEIVTTNYTYDEDGNVLTKEYDGGTSYYLTTYIYE